MAQRKRKDEEQYQAARGRRIDQTIAQVSHEDSYRNAMTQGGPPISEQLNGLQSNRARNVVVAGQYGQIGISGGENLNRRPMPMQGQPAGSVPEESAYQQWVRGSEGALADAQRRERNAMRGAKFTRDTKRNRDYQQESVLARQDQQRIRLEGEGIRQREEQERYRTEMQAREDQQLKQQQDQEERLKTAELLAKQNIAMAPYSEQAKAARREELDLLKQQRLEEIEAKHKADTQTAKTQEELASKNRIYDLEKTRLELSVQAAQAHGAAQDVLIKEMAGKGVQIDVSRIGANLTSATNRESSVYQESLAEFGQYVNRYFPGEWKPDTVDYWLNMLNSDGSPKTGSDQYKELVKKRAQEERELMGYAATIQRQQTSGEEQQATTEQLSYAEWHAQDVEKIQDARRKQVRSDLTKLRNQSRLTPSEKILMEELEAEAKELD